MPKQPPLPTPRKPRDFTALRPVAEQFEHSDAASTGRLVDQSTGGPGDPATEDAIAGLFDSSGARAPGKTIIRRPGRLTKNGRKGARGATRKMSIEIAPALGAKLEAEKARRWREGVTLGDIVVEMMRATGRAPEKLPKPSEGRAGR